MDPGPVERVEPVQPAAPGCGEQERVRQPAVSEQIAVVDPERETDNIGVGQHGGASK